MNSSKPGKLRTLAIGLAVALGFAGLTGCAPQPNPSPTPSVTPTQSPTPTPTSTAGPLKVVSSVAVWAELAKQIGGDAVSVTAIIKAPFQDPHSYEATVRDQLAVNEAQVTIENGAGYDTFFAHLLSAKPVSSNWKRIDVSRVLGSGLPIRPDTNPHFWYDYAFAKKTASKIYEVLAVELPPADKPALSANLGKLNKSIDALISRASQLRKRTLGTKVLLSESFAAFTLDALGLWNVMPTAFTNSVEQETDASPSVMNQIKGLITSHTVKLVIFNRQTLGAQTNQIAGWARTSGVPVIWLSELLPEQMTYTTWMNAVLTQISGALK